MKLIQRLRSLAKQIDIVLEVKTSNIVKLFNNNSTAICLAYQSEYLCMTFFSKDNDSTTSLILILDSFL